MNSELLLYNCSIQETERLNNEKAYVRQKHVLLFTTFKCYKK